MTPGQSFERKVLELDSYDQRIAEYNSSVERMNR